MITLFEFKRAQRHYRKAVDMLYGTSRNGEAPKESAYRHEIAMYARHHKWFESKGGHWEIYETNSLSKCPGYHKTLLRMYKLFKLETDRIVKEELSTFEAGKFWCWTKTVDTNIDTEKRNEYRLKYLGL